MVRCSSRMKNLMVSVGVRVSKYWFVGNVDRDMTVCMENCEN